MANGQQVAKKNLNSFIAWTLSQSDDDFRKLVFQGKLNRTEIARYIGCGKSALRQNPALRQAIDDLELELRDKGILPPVQGKDNEPEIKPYVNNTNINSNEIRRIAFLEQENMELKVKNKELELKLERFNELSNSLYELGLLPR